MNKVDPAQSVIFGTTKLYAIIGDPIAQVGSPRVFNPIIARAGVDAVLVPMRVAAEDLKAAFAGIKATQNFHGLIATIPHKIPMLALMDTVLPTGRLVGAVNAMRREKDGRWTGDMFDGRGCVRGMKDAMGVEARGRDALLLGAGGAGKAVGCALAEAGARRLTVYDIDRARADQLVAAVAGAFPRCKAAPGKPDPAGHDLIVNCTPLGMRPDDPPPVDLAALDRSMAVVDVVVKDEPTPLRAAARAKGCKAMSGIDMLRGQAMEISRFFGFV
ncbi:MAG: shikimate dehydrogenase family protein [Rhodospirillales bacterium]